jgi:putative ABC transport system permease protein
MTNEPYWRRYRDLVRRRPQEDVDDEIRLHLEMRRDEALRMGLPPEQADAEVRERFGDVDKVVAELYSIDGAREARRRRADWAADLAQDVRFAMRSLRRAPSFALTAILSSALAIAANTTVFSFVSALLIEPLPYREPAELVSLQANIIGSAGEMLALRERSTSYADIGIFGRVSITLNDDREAARIDGAGVSGNVMEMLGVRPLLGAAFDVGASRPGAGNVMLLSHAFWVDRYGGDRDVIGRRVMVDGAPFTIVGVMPPSFHFPSVNARFWVPLTIDPANITATWAIGGNGFLARLRPGVSPERATAELRAVLPGMRRLNPRWDPGEAYGRPADASPLQDSLVGEQRPALLVLMGCVFVVLLVACVNLANLMLARVTAREREFSVRSALGGGRGRLIRQLLAESMVTALLGGALGTGLAFLLVRWGVAALPASMARTADVHLSIPVLLFTAAVAMFTGIAFGLLPALRAASASGSVGVAHLSRGPGGGRSHDRVSRALVAAEVALAVLLAIAAGLLTRSFGRLSDLAPGFQTEHVITARISPPAASYGNALRTNAFYAAVGERVAAMPGVSAVGFVDRLPIASPVFGMGVRVEGQFEDGTQLLPTAQHLQSITPGYLTVMGLPVLRGRGFTDDDRAESAPVALVSQSLARRFWPNADAVGKRIGYPYPSPWITIVGVVPDVRLDSLRDTSAIAVLMPFAQRPRYASPGMSIVLRTTANPGAVGRQLRDIVGSIDRSVAVTSVRTMSEVIGRSVERPRFTMMLVGGFALAALLLGITGIYGVMSYTVSQRLHEMGIRAALGATSRDIFRLVVGRGAVLAVIGAAAGCLLALLGTRALGSLLYGVSATDPLTFAGVVLLFVAVAVAASVGPAWRATRADPASALRE